MELRHLRYFLAVAEELHFGRAAARLGIAQPPLSRQVRQLEQELGTALLRRNSRGVALTEPGQIFLERARQVLAQANEAVDATRASGAGKMGKVTIGMGGSVAFSVLPVVLRRFRQDYSDVSLTLLEMSTMEQLQALKERRIDLGFVRRLSPDPAIEVVLSVQEAICAALPANHPLAARDEVAQSDLAGEPFVSFPGPTYHMGPTGAFPAQTDSDLRPQVVLQADALLTVLGLVASGYGVATVPASVAAQIRLAGLVFRPIGPPYTPLELHIATRVGETSPGVLAFRRVALEALQAAGDFGTLAPAEK